MDWSSGHGADELRAAGTSTPLAAHADVLRLSVLLLMFYGGSGWSLDVPLKVACGAALMIPRLRMSPAWWITTTGLIVFINGMSWHSIDNHKYLISYWALCITMAAAWPDRGRDIVAWNARGLIAGCFVFAVAWKLLAGEYVDGSFLHHTSLTDGRVQVAASAVGGIEPSHLRMNRQLSGLIQTWPSESAVVYLRSSERMNTVALVASYWTLAIESAVAILGAIPRFNRFVAKDVALMLFVLTTYFLLPVVGFATILGVLGFAAAVHDGRAKLGRIYLLVIGLAQLASVPWDDYAARFLVR